MLDDGFVDEVKHLREVYNLNSNLASMRSVGYRQVWQYLDGNINKREMTEQAIIATRQLCKRQSTWFRNEESAMFIESSVTSNITKVLEYV